MALAHILIDERATNDLTEKRESRARIESDSGESPASADNAVGPLRKEQDAHEGAKRSRAIAFLSNPGAEVKPGWEKSSRGRYSIQFAHV